MDRRTHESTWLALCSLLALAGCSESGESAPRDSGSPDAPTVPPVVPSDAGITAPPDAMSADALAALGPCIVSLDCPSGTHCDLGACTQDCSNVQPCPEGKVCGPRARCIDQGDVDRDGVPDGGFAGTFAATPAAVALTPRSTSFPLTLTVTNGPANADVPYRVELRGAHLKVDAERGTIHGGKLDIAITVDPSKVSGAHQEGMVSIITPLGTAEVSAPIDMGISGGYHAVLSFDDPASAQLGAFPFVIALSESNGALLASVDPSRAVSLVDERYGAARGTGAVAANGNLELTLVQRVGQDFQAPAGAGPWAGWSAAQVAQGAFRRDVARQIALHLAPSTTQDGFEGTFDETDYSIFSTPVTTRGHVTLVRSAAEGALVASTDAPPALPAAPAANTFLAPSAAGWSDTSKPTCADIVCGGGTCPTDAASVAALVRATEEKYGLVYYPYIASPSPTGFTALATACAGSVTATTLAGTTGCGNVVPLACALQVTAGASPAPTPALYLTFQRLVAEIANPALAAARNHLVLAATESERMGTGAAEERQHYVAAMDVVDRALGWVLAPAVLDFLKSTPATMRGENAFSITYLPPGGSTTITVPFSTYPAARAIANLLSTRSLAALELVRIGAVHPSNASALASAQRLNLLSFLEARALGSVLDAWGTGDPSLTARLEGMVQSSSRLTSQLLTGANAFGLPEGYVPFIYNPADITHLSNFDQVLASGDGNITQLTQTAAAVVADKREFDVQTAALDAATTSIKAEYDNPIHAACGAAFNLDLAPKDVDWSLCGASGGAVLSLYQAIDEAAANQTSALGLVAADEKKIEIASRTLAANQNLDRKLIAFTKQNGDAIAAIDFASGVLDAAQQAASAAASVTNPFGLLAVCGIYGAGLAKAGLAAGKDELETAEKMQNLATGMKKEFNDGMASIKSQMVDMAQHNIEVQSKAIALTQARTDLVNAVANAKNLYQTRADALAQVKNGGIGGPDPTARLVRDQEAVSYLAARDAAQKDLYRAAQALQYDVNVPLSADLVADAVFSANTAAKIESLRTCLSSVFSDHQFKYGVPVEYRTELSVRKALHITGDVTDPVTGETLTAGQQFRRIMLASANVETDGSVRFSFPTNLLADNGLWSTDLCEDRITNVEAKLVGDSLGDNDVQVNLLLSGTNFVRACQPGAPVRAWSLDARGAGPDPFAIIQGGVNTYGPNDPSPGINHSLFGQSVARATWTLELPSRGRAPANADIDLQHIDDLVLRVQHKALPVQSSSTSDVDTSCIFKGN